MLLAEVNRFLGSTSCHGLNSVDLSGSKPKALFWLATSAIAFGALIVFVQDVLGNQRRQMVVMTEIKTGDIPFPAVTFCSLNPYMKSKISQVPELQAITGAQKMLANSGKPKGRRKRQVASIMTENELRKIKEKDCWQSTCPTNAHCILYWEDWEDRCFQSIQFLPMSYVEAQQVCRNSSSLKSTGKLASLDSELSLKEAEDKLHFDWHWTDTQGLNSEHKCSAIDMQREPPLRSVKDCSQRTLSALCEYIYIKPPKPTLSAEEKSVADEIEKKVGEMADVIEKDIIDSIIGELFSTSEFRDGDVSELPADPIASQAKIVEMMTYLTANMSVEQLSSLGIQKDDLFFRCTYDEKKCAGDAFHSFHDPKFGNCFTFNWNGTKTVNRPGQAHGLKVLLKAWRNEFMGTTQSVGVQFLIHNPQEKPFMDLNGSPVPTGFEYQFSLKATKQKRFDKCRTEKFGDENFMYKANYSLQACIESCIQREVAKECGCISPTRPFLPNNTGNAHHNKPCTRLRKKCLDYFINTKAETLPCDECQQPCEEWAYQIASSGSLWPAWESVLPECAVIQKGRHECVRELRKDGVLVSVFVMSTSYSSLVEAPRLSNSMTLSTVGNFMSILLGMSIVTLIEIAAALIHIIFLMITRI